MPNQCHSGVRGDPWHDCDVCGVSYRCSQLRRQAGLKRGLLVCRKCYDNPTSFYRDNVIQEVLSQNADTEMAIADILKEPNSNDSSY